MEKILKIFKKYTNPTVEQKDENSKLKDKEKKRSENL